MSLLKHMIERFENPFERFEPPAGAAGQITDRPGGVLALSLLAETR